jgi:integrase
LEEEITRIYSNYRTNGEVPTPDLLRDRLNVAFERKPAQAPESFLSFIEKYIESVKLTKSETTLKGYKNSLRHLQEYNQSRPKSKKIDFHNINLDFYGDYKEYLIRKGFVTNTIAKQIKNIKVFMNEATERGINTNLDFRSRRFKVETEETESIYLSEEEIRQIYDLDLSENVRLEKVRDLFIVGCYTGLRFSDFSQIRPENIKNGCIQLRTQKTDEVVAVPIHPMVAAVMEKYKGKYPNSLPPANSNQKMNQYLKEIGQLAELNQTEVKSKRTGVLRVNKTVKKYELVTTHTARRSFATNLFLAGFPAISIMKITGHRTEKAFMRYIKITPEQNAQKLREFWNQKVQPLMKVV